MWYGVCKTNLSIHFHGWWSWGPYVYGVMWIQFMSITGSIYIDLFFGVLSGVHMPSGGGVWGRVYRHMEWVGIPLRTKLLFGFINVSLATSRCSAKWIIFKCRWRSNCSLVWNWFYMRLRGICGNGQTRSSLFDSMCSNWTTAQLLILRWVWWLTMVVDAW